MAKSKCTCKRRPAVHVLNENYPHEPGCYYVEVFKQRADARALRETANRLTSYYRHKSQSEKG